MSNFLAFFRISGGSSAKFRIDPIGFGLAGGIIKIMDWIDGLLGIGLIGLVSVAVGLIWPPYGYIAGALVGGFLAWRALKQRRKLLKDQKENKESKPPA